MTKHLDKISKMSTNQIIQLFLLI